MYPMRFTCSKIVELGESPCVRKLTSPVESTFHSYVIKGAICALCLCERNFPRKLAFAYLEDIGNEFVNQNANRIDAVTRPYHFLEFGELR